MWIDQREKRIALGVLGFMILQVLGGVIFFIWLQVVGL